MIDRLEALAALAKGATMAEVGTQLRVSQSAVSKRIASLEAEVGRKLVEREGRRVVLTPDGSRLVARAEPLLAELRATLAEGSARSAGMLRVGVSESILGSWGAKLLSRARAALAPATLELHAHRSPVVIDHVRGGEYPVGLVAGHCERAPDLHAELLLEEPMLLVGAGTTPPADPGKRSYDVLTIEPRSATWESVARRAARAGIVPGATLESFFTIAQLARAGFAVGLVPAGVARALGIPRSATRPAGFGRPVSLVARKTTLGRPLVARLQKELEGAARDVARELG